MGSCTRMGVATINREPLFKGLGVAYSNVNEVKVSGLHSSQCDCGAVVSLGARYIGFFELVELLGLLSCC